MLCVILVPLILGAVLTTWVAASSSKRLLDERAHQFGGAIADQLAISITDQLVQKDVLGLNITLNNLLGKGDFDFASVYSADNKLLAQAGKNTGNLMIFSRGVVFQNAAAGTLQVGLARHLVDSPTNTILFTSLLVPLIFIGVILLFGWTYSDFVYLWLTLPKEAREPLAPVEDEDEQELAPIVPIEEVPDVPVVLERVTILVVKIRPPRMLDKHRAAIAQALALHGGDVQPGSGDFVAMFQTRSQIVEAIRSAVLVNTLLHLGRDHVTVKLSVHTTPTAAGVEKATKQATYLASISDNVLLASREVYEVLADSDQVTMQPFHNSLTPEGEVYFVDSLNGQNQELIQRQARQLFNA